MVVVDVVVVVAVVVDIGSGSFITPLLGFS